MLDFIVFLFWTSVILFPCGLILFLVIRQRSKNRAADAKLRVSNLEGFNAQDIYVSTHNTNGFAIDIENNKVLLITRSHEKELDYENLISVEVLQDNATVISTSRGSQLAGAAIGGALFGVAGAVVGGLSGSQTSSSKVKKNSTKINHRRF